MIIKSFSRFINEVSGTELVGPIGPAYGETRLQNKTVNFHNTNIFLCDLDNKFYTIDEFNSLYNDYLKSGGKILNGEFNRENLNTLVAFFRDSES